MTRQFRLISLMIVTLLLCIEPILAEQSAQEIGVIETAYDLVGENCQALNRDQACYGHAQLVAESRAGFDTFVFSGAGDIEDLVKIQSLRLSGLDPVAQTWGIAMLQLRANLPDSRPENVTILAFGDVALENSVAPATGVPVSATNYANVRQAPSTQAAVLTSITPGQRVMAVERLADNSWLRIKLADEGLTGWVYGELLDPEAEITSLNSAEPRSSYYEQPMQAFIFETGADEQSFSELPSNGLLIQTPEGLGEVNLLINEVNIQLGSTVFFQAQAGGFMTISTVEGHADVRVGNIEFTAFPGSKVMVPLDDNLAANGPPMPPQPYDMEVLEFLPYGLLARQVEPVAPLSQVEIDDLIVENALEQAYIECPNQDCDSQAVDTPCTGAGCGDPDDEICPDAPGRSCLAPGQTTCPDAPGQSCNAPGQGGTAPGNSGSSNRGGNGQGNGGGNGQGNGGGNGQGNGNN